MPKSDLPFDPADYSPVAERISLFHERFRDGRIVTDLVSHTQDQIVFVARVYRYAGEAQPAATGWSAERVGDGDINTVACLENAETSAIGRALANLGFTASRRRPSREEMEKAERVRRTAAPLPHQEMRSRQAIADDVLDLIALVRTAQRYGMRPARAERLRSRAVAGAYDSHTRTRLARMLRRWIARRFQEHAVRRPSSDSTTD